ncbi:hypothetical protein [Burkholderia cenocepacia]|nr:hypothetical protein [Burkholderia cenocepacia]USB88783.1 hypothetical protein NBG98_33485 [Burkholderia cenocepacia]
MSTAKRTPMPRMVERKCERCGLPFRARAADVKRGWGRFCSKSCKAGAQAGHQERQDSDTPTFSNAHQFSNYDHDCNKDQ